MTSRTRSASTGHGAAEQCRDRGCPAGRSAARPGDSLQPAAAASRRQRRPRRQHPSARAARRTDTEMDPRHPASRPAPAARVPSTAARSRGSPRHSGCRPRSRTAGPPLRPPPPGSRRKAADRSASRVHSSCHSAGSLTISALVRGVVAARAALDEIAGQGERARRRSRSAARPPSSAMISADGLADEPRSAGSQRRNGRDRPRSERAER